MGPRAPRLCHSCARRVGGGVLHEQCFVCGGMMGTIRQMAGTVLERVASYEFETFTFGATLPALMLDRDDYVRSYVGATGARSVKAALTSAVCSALRAKTGRRLDHVDPDITILYDARFGSCEVRSRHIMMHMRYVKTRRGISQRSTDGPSIQDAISDYLLELVGGTGVRFTWVGGEDRDSLVLGGGRPVYARICNPLRRTIHMVPSVRLDGIRLSDMVVLDHLPDVGQFSSVARITIRHGGDPNIRDIRRLAGVVSVRNDSGRVVQKRVGPVRYRNMGNSTFHMMTDLEGGIPVKRMVNGQGVEPSVSSVLGVPCECVRFDFMDINS